MVKNAQNQIRATLAIVGVPLAFAMFVAIAYQVSRKPFHSSFGAAVFLSVLGACVVCGGIGLSRLFKRFEWKALAFIVYTIPMSVFLIMIGGSVACMNGDCV